MTPDSSYANAIPVGVPVPVISVSPIVLSTPDRAVDLEMQVSAPTTGGELPIILLSHGQGQSNHLSSLDGYGPLANFWAAHGFVVVQPTHLSSRTLTFDPNSPEGALFWRSRAQDMKRVFDRLDEVEAAMPAIAGRLDRSKIAVVGQSMGGHAACILLSMRAIHPSDGSEVDLMDTPIKAGVILAAPGNGGADLNPAIAERFPFFRQTNSSGPGKSRL